MATLNCSHCGKVSVANFVVDPVGNVSTNNPTVCPRCGRTVEKPSLATGAPSRSPSVGGTLAFALLLAYCLIRFVGPAIWHNESGEDPPVRVPRETGSGPTSPDNRPTDSDRDDGNRPASRPAGQPLEGLYERIDRAAQQTNKE